MRSPNVRVKNRSGVGFDHTTGRIWAFAQKVAQGDRRSAIGDIGQKTDVTNSAIVAVTSHMLHNLPAGNIGSIYTVEIDGKYFTLTVMPATDEDLAAVTPGLKP